MWAINFNELFLDFSVLYKCRLIALHKPFKAGSPLGGKMSRRKNFRQSNWLIELSPRKNVEPRIVGQRSTFRGSTLFRLVEIRLKGACATYCFCAPMFAFLIIRKYYGYRTAANFSALCIKNRCLALAVSLKDQKERRQNGPDVYFTELT